MAIAIERSNYSRHIRIPWMSRWRPLELWAIFQGAPRARSEIFHVDCWRCIFKNVLLNILIAQRRRINRIMAMSRGRTPRVHIPKILAAFGSVSSIDVFYNVRVPPTERKSFAREERYPAYRPKQGVVEHDSWGKNSDFRDTKWEKKGRKKKAY